MALYITRVSIKVMAGLSLLATHAAAQSAPDLSRQIAEVMSQGQSGKAHQRYVHAKGIVCQGSFQASPGAKAISRAPHLDGKSIPITVRFSDGAPDTTIADNSPEAAPRGMAIRFAVGRGTDIMAFSHNGFLVGTGEEFLALVKAQAATVTSAPHPWPIEEFLNSHPRALKFVQDPKPIPVSFGTESFYANNAFIFINTEGQKQAGRYQIIPVGGAQYLDDATAKGKSPNFLSEELPGRLAAASFQFRLVLQLPNPGDQTNDGSVVWPDDRRKVELGFITITSAVPDSAAAERELAFDPTHLIDGIELSDDPLPALRSRVYAYSVAGRRSK
ncbi:MAG: catalase family peroxidase [Bryobacteraceae bacterium]